MNAEVLLKYFDRISEAPDAVPRLRRFVLDLAVRGKLVEQDPSDEPASALLARIPTPAQDRARKQALMGRNPPEQMKMIAAQPPFTAQYPDRSSPPRSQGGDTNPHNATSGIIFDGAVEQRSPIRATGTSDRPAQSPSGAPGDAPFACPSNWIWVQLGDVCSKTGSGSTPRGGKSVYKDLGVPFLRSQNVYDDGLRLDDVAYIDHETHSRMSGTAVQPDDLLLNITGGSIGRCCRVPSALREANVSQHVAIIRPAINGIHPYLHCLIRSPYFQWFVIGEQTGAGRGGLPKNRMDRIPIALAPLAEQHRIVAKADELMALCDRLEAAQKDRELRRNRLTASSIHHLTNGAAAEDLSYHARFFINHLPKLTARPEQIKQIRQTILNLAVRGKLAPQDPGDEPASGLLKRIEAEKARLSTEGGLKKDKTAWDGLPGAPPYGLPRNWIWTRLQDVFEISRGGSPRPAGDPLYFEGPIPWITVREITKDGEKYLTETEGSLTEEGAKRSRFIEPGDLLLTNSGATLGVPKISRIRACMNDGVAVLRLFHSIPLNDFAYLYLHSQTAAFRTVNQGMGQPNLNTPIIAGWFFPLPPLTEQQRIVAKVDEVMALCDQMEARLARGLTEARDLLEAVLHEAISGGSLRAASSPA